MRLCSPSVLDLGTCCAPEHLKREEEAPQSPPPTTDLSSPPSPVGLLSPPPWQSVVPPGRIHVVLKRSCVVSGGPVWS